MVGFDLDPDLSLALHTGHVSQYTDESTSSSEKHATNTRDHEICNGKAGDQKTTLTIFYDGQMSTTNVTEIQGRAIISMAKREMKKVGRSNLELKERTNMYPLQIWADVEAKRKKAGSFQDFSHQFHSNSTSQMLNQNQELSMKQSLQRFLQKRRTRIASASPYI